MAVLGIMLYLFYSKKKMVFILFRIKPPQNDEKQKRKISDTKIEILYFCFRSSMNSPTSKKNDLNTENAGFLNSWKELTGYSATPTHPYKSNILCEFQYIISNILPNMDKIVYNLFWGVTAKYPSYEQRKEIYKVTQCKCYGHRQTSDLFVNLCISTSIWAHEY